MVGGTRFSWHAGEAGIHACFQQVQEQANQILIDWSPTHSTACPALRSAQHSALSTTSLHLRLSAVGTVPHGVADVSARTPYQPHNTPCCSGIAQLRSARSGQWQQKGFARRCCGRHWKASRGRSWQRWPCTPRQRSGVREARGYATGELTHSVMHHGRFGHG